MSYIAEDQGAEHIPSMNGEPGTEIPEHDSSAAVAIELLGGSTIDHALPEKKKVIPESIALLLLVIVVAGGGLFAMRKLGLGSQIQFTSVKIDYKIEDGAFDGKEHDLLADLRNSQIEQVPLDQVQKNPFLLIGDEHQVADLSPGIPGETAAAAERRRQLEERQRAIVNAYAGLDLNSILLGSVPVARISGQTVRIGDVVEGLFHVKTISARAVDLEVDGEMYTLSLGE